MLYKEGQKVKYQTSYIKTRDRENFPHIRVGIIEEVFATLDKKPCYWIEGEKELILHSQIINAE